MFYTEVIILIQVLWGTTEDNLEDLRDRLGMVQQSMDVGGGGTVVEEHIQ